MLITYTDMKSNDPALLDVRLNIIVKPDQCLPLETASAVTDDMDEHTGETPISDDGSSKRPCDKVLK